MRFKIKKHKEGDTKIVTRFAWLPTQVRNEEDEDIIIWLESYDVKLKYSDGSYGYYGGKKGWHRSERKRTKGYFKSKGSRLMEAIKEYRLAEELSPEDSKDLDTKTNKTISCGYSDGALFYVDGVSHGIEPYIRTGYHKEINGVSAPWVKYAKYKSGVEPENDIAGSTSPDLLSENKFMEGNISTGIFPWKDEGSKEEFPSLGRTSAGCGVS